MIKSDNAAMYSERDCIIIEELNNGKQIAVVTPNSSVIFVRTTELSGDLLQRIAALTVPEIFQVHYSALKSIEKYRTTTG